MLSRIKRVASVNTCMSTKEDYAIDVSPLQNWVIYSWALWSLDSNKRNQRWKLHSQNIPTLPKKRIYFIWKTVMNIRKANDREGSCPEGGGGGSYPSMQNSRGDVQEGKCPFTHKISLTHLIENVHSLTMHIFKEKKKRHFPQSNIRCMRVFRYHNPTHYHNCWSLIIHTSAIIHVDPFVCIALSHSSLSAVFDYENAAFYDLSSQ